MIMVSKGPDELRENDKLSEVEPSGAVVQVLTHKLGTAVLAGWSLSLPRLLRYTYLLCNYCTPQHRRLRPDSLLW